MWEQIVDFRSCGSLDHSPWLVSFKYGCEGVSLMGLSAADASEAFTTALTFPRERSQRANISPGKGFVVEFSQEAGPSERGDWQPLLQVSMSYPKELKGQNEAAP